MLKKLIIALVISLGLVTLILNKKDFVETKERFVDDQEIQLFIAKIGSLVEQDNLSELEYYVTETPDAYIEDYYEAVRIYKKIGKDDFRKLREKKVGEFTTEPFRRVFSDKKELVEYAFTGINFIKAQKLKFNGITKLVQNGEKARCLLNFTNDELTNYYFEALLYKTNDKWKVFSFESNDSSNLYKVKYAESDNQ